MKLSRLKRSSLRSIHFEIRHNFEKLLKFEHLVDTIDRIWVHFKIYRVTDYIKVKFLGINVADICHKIKLFSNEIQSSPLLHQF